MSYDLDRWQQLAGILNQPSLLSIPQDHRGLLQEADLESDSPKDSPIDDEQASELRQAFAGSWSWLKEKLGPYLDPVVTFTAGGGPGGGFVLKDPIPGSGWDDALFAFDMDVTGPGSGILLAPETAANWIETIPQDWAKTTAAAVRKAPGKVYLGVELVGLLPVPFVGLAGNTEDKDKIAQFIETSKFGKWLMSKSEALEILEGLPPNKVYDDLDSLWEYTVIDGIWHTRRQDRDSEEWVSFEQLSPAKREKAEEILNRFYPSALSVAAERDAEAKEEVGAEEEAEEEMLGDEPVPPKPEVDAADTSRIKFLWSPEFRSSKTMLLLYVMFRAKDDPRFLQTLSGFSRFVDEKNIDLENLSFSSFVAMVSAMRKGELDLSHSLFSGVGEMQEDLKNLSTEDKRRFETWFAKSVGISAVEGREIRRQADVERLIRHAEGGLGISLTSIKGLRGILDFAQKIGLI